MNIQFIFMILYVIYDNILVHYCDTGDKSAILCDDNILEYVLPYGIGSTDGIVLHFTNLVDQNCTIIINSKEGLQIVVVESNLNYKYSTNNISIISKDEYLNDVCLSDCLYVNVLKTLRSKIQLQMNYSRDLKITVTAARSIEKLNLCNKTHEIQCKINGSKLCISKELQCDSNINCGSYNLNDEDSKICETDIGDNKIFVLSAGFVCILVLITIFLYTVKKYSPRMPKVFFIAHDKIENTLVTLNNSHAPKQQSLQSIQNGNVRSVPVRQTDGNLTITLMPKRKKRSKRTRIKRMRYNSPALEEISLGSCSGEDGNNVEPTEILNIKLKHKNVSSRHLEGFSTDRQMRRHDNVNQTEIM